MVQTVDMCEYLLIVAHLGQRSVTYDGEMVDEFGYVSLNSDGSVLQLVHIQKIIMVTIVEALVFTIMTVQVKPGIY